MIETERELAAFVRRVREQYRRDAAFFGDRRLPEYEALSGIDGTDRERALFLAFGLVPYHESQSGAWKPLAGRTGLWRVCATVWRRHEWAFVPERLVGDDRKSDLAAVFDRLEIMDPYDADWWYRTAVTLRDEVRGDPLVLLEECSAVAPWVGRTVRSHACPGLAGDVATPLWVRTLDDQVRDLSWLEEVSMPVDPVVFDATVQLGGLDLDYDDRGHRQLVGDFWNVFARKQGVAPLELEPILRLLGLFWESGGQAHAETVLATVRE